MNILFLTNIPSPYRVKFFSMLGKVCHLTVLYEIQHASNRNKNWKADEATSFDEVYMNTHQLIADGGITFDIFQYIKKGSYDLIVVGTHGTPTAKLAMMYMRLRRIPYILNVDGMLSAEIPEKSKLNRFLRCMMFKGASAYITSGKDTIKYLKDIGVKSSNMYTYHFSSVTESDILKRPVTSEEKISLKKELAIREKKMFISVARFIPKKGLDLLIKAFGRISDDDIALVLIGGDKSVYIPLLEMLPADVRSRIYFPGFMSKERLYQYYKAADVFVLPTHHDEWGLVINEALACGLPAITTNRCGAGLEIIKDGENGYLLDHNDEKGLAQTMKYMISNSRMLHDMACKNLELAHNYTIDNMVKDHIKIFDRLLKNSSK